MEWPLDELRPLVCAVCYPDGEGVTFLVGRRELRLGGDRELIGGVLALCDGSLSVAQIADRLPDGAGADARELIAALHREGAVLDCAEAWRRFDRESSVRARLYRPAGAELLDELASTRSRPLGEPLRDEPLEPRPSRIAELAAARRSAVPADGPRPVAYGELSSVLAVMYGRPAGGGRPVPSGGGLYPLVVHVVLRCALAGLEPGVWWYEPESDRLRLLAAPAPPTYELFLADNTCAGLLERDQPVVFLSADVGRSARKYSNRAYRFALIEVGAAMQNAYLACAELGLPVRAAAGFDEPAVAEQLRLPDGCVPLLSVLLGA